MAHGVASVRNEMTVRRRIAPRVAASPALEHRRHGRLWRTVGMAGFGAPSARPSLAHRRHDPKIRRAASPPGATGLQVASSGAAMAQVVLFRRTARMGAGIFAPGDDPGVGLGKTFRTRNQTFDHLLVLAGEDPVMRPAAPEVIMHPVIQRAQEAMAAPIVDVEAARGGVVDRGRPLYQAILAALAADDDHAGQPRLELVLDAVEA